MDKSTKAKKKKKASVEEPIVFGQADKLPKKKKKVRPEEDVPVKKKKRTPEEKAERRAIKAAKAMAKVERKTSKLEEALGGLDLEKISSTLAPGERDILEEYVWLFNRTGRLIRRMETKALQSGDSRDIYALSTLISQQREIIADIRTLTDLSAQTSMIKNAVLQPMSSSLAQNLLDTYYQLRRLLSEVTNPKDTQFALTKLDDIVKEQSRFLQIQYNASTEKVERIMAGEDVSVSDDAPPGKKRKRRKKG